MSLEGKQGPPPDKFTGTNPAAGAESSEAVPAGEQWDILAYEITLVASAVVANRNVDIIYEDGSGIEIASNRFATSITANQTVKIHIGKYETLPADTATDHFHKLPNELELAPAFLVKTVTANIDTGDDFSAPSIIRKRWKA